MSLAALGLLFLPALGCSTAESEESPKQTSQAVSADVDGTPRADVLPHWDELSGRSEAEPAVRWGALGTPKSVFGALTVAKNVVSSDDARSFIAENARLFKIAEDLDDLDAAERVDTPMGSHFIFTQRYQGVRVYGGEIKVHYNREGRVVAVNNSVVPDVRLASVEPALSAERARAIIESELVRSEGRVLDSEEAVEAPELVIYAEQRAPALAWRVVVPTIGATIQVFVDARSGAVLSDPVDINRYFVDGTGQIFKDNAVVATQNNSLVDSADAASAVPASAYSVVTLQGLSGTGKIEGQFASSATSKARATSATNSFLFTRESKAFNETMGYFHIDLAERYIQSLGFTNVNNRQQVFSVDKSTADNSFYSPSTRNITFGTGGVDDAEDGEVIIHEYGHSIQDNQVPGFGSTLEGGSMGEGFGDYWGATVTASLSGGFQDTCIAEWDAVSYASGVPHCLRRLDSTKHYPENVKGEVHADGEMWSAVLWEIRTALGAAKADKLVLQSHFLLSSSANFSDGSNALVTAAVNLGFTSTEVSTVRTILKNRGFTVTA